MGGLSLHLLEGLDLGRVEVVGACLLDGLGRHGQGPDGLGNGAMVNW